MERAKEVCSQSHKIVATELTEAELDKVTGGATIPVKRKTPQPKVYTA
jgi:bacteriocin-like protein